MQMHNIKISSLPLDIQSGIDWATSPESGGLNIFLGTVRNETQGKKVLRLEFECYEKMALKEMEKIAVDIKNKFLVQRILLHHRIGILNIKEVPVLIIISAAHRDAAFKACRYAIDTLKEKVPIWKKEIFEDGETWVAAHP